MSYLHNHSTSNSGLAIHLTNFSMAVMEIQGHDLFVDILKTKTKVLQTFLMPTTNLTSSYFLRNLQIKVCDFAWWLTINDCAVIDMGHVSPWHGFETHHGLMPRLWMTKCFSYDEQIKSMM